MARRTAAEKRFRNKRESRIDSAQAPKLHWQMNSERAISFSRVEFACAGAVFLIALLLYSWTLAPTVTLTDSGELIVVAHGLGVAHPPGFPLWVILAHLASLVPLGNVAVRINFSSALFAALASAILTLVVAELMITTPYLPTWKKRSAQQKKKAEDSRIGQLLICAPALGAGLLMAFSRTLWSYATIAEVYTLNTLLILVVLFLMLRWRRCIVADRRDAGQAITTHDGWLYAGALPNGLARIRACVATLAARLRFRRHWQRFQTGPHNLLVSPVYCHCQSGLRPQLPNCRGQGCVLSARVYFDRDCRWLWHPLVDPTRCLQVDAGYEIVSGRCNCYSAHICDGVRGELAGQQSQGLLYRARLRRKSVQHNRAQWSFTNTRLAGRLSHVLCTGDRTTPTRRKSGRC